MLQQHHYQMSMPTKLPSKEIERFPFKSTNKSSFIFISCLTLWHFLFESKKKISLNHFFFFSCLKGSLNGQRTTYLPFISSVGKSPNPLYYVNIYFMFFGHSEVFILFLPRHVCCAQNQPEYKTKQY